MKRNQKEIIGWYEYTVHEYDVGINDEQYGIVTNYEPIFEGEKESDAIERVRYAQESDIELYEGGINGGRK